MERWQQATSEALEVFRGHISRDFNERHAVVSTAWLGESGEVLVNFSLDGKWGHGWRVALDAQGNWVSDEHLWIS